MEVKLRVVEGPHQGTLFTFREHDSFIVGRAEEAHFSLPEKDQYVSRIHFLVEINPPLCRLMDMGSTNGTFVNNERVQAADLKQGDMIQVGQTVVRVSIDQGLDRSEESTVIARHPPPGVQAPPHVEVDTTIRPQLRIRLPAAGGGSMSQTPAAGTEGIAPAAAQPTALSTAARPQAKPPVSDTKLWQETLVERQSFEEPPPPPPDKDTLKLLPPDYLARSKHRPQIFPGYRIIDEIGRGGMGIVYLALYEDDQSVVALKAIAPAASGTPADLERFLREASILRELEHPHIVSFREMGAAHGHVFFAMDYVPGTTVDKMLDQQDGPLPVERAANLICQLLDALQYAHAKGIVHRDIKPANLLIMQQNGGDFVKLTDFGLARTYLTSRLSGLTLLGDVGGTTAYMAPEQITNFRGSQHQVDQYSAAATLYYLLTRKHVYDFPPEVGKQFSLILEKAPVPIHLRRRDLPSELCVVIHRALSRQPADRYPDAGSMRDALLKFC